MGASSRKFQQLATGLDLTTPSLYQVSQRTGSIGTISIAGTVWSGTHDVECSYAGGSFTTVAAAASGSFTGALTSQPAGSGQLVCREVDAPNVMAIVDTVGIGDLFPIMGQSNAVGQAVKNYQYSDRANTVEGYAPFAAIYGGDYQWHLLADPVGYQTGWVDSVNSNVGAGNFGSSIWPLVASSFLASQNVPVAFIPCAKDSTAISSWLPGASHTDRSTLYGACVFRAQQVTSAVKGVLWWQGETDAVNGTSAATYETNLKAVADAFNADLGGAVLVPVLLQQGSGMTNTNRNAINTGISNAHTNDSTHVMAPADFTNLYADDTFHLKVDGNVFAAANGGATISMWAALQAAFSYP